MGILLAARKSDLARLQAYQVGKALEEQFPSEEIKYKFRESLGDINQDDPLWKMPEKGVFTEDFRQGLIDGTWDMVVHSWKDLPVEQEEGTEIVATLPRADTRDLFLFKKDQLSQVKKTRCLNIFSSSPRRIYNLTPFFKDYFPGGLEEVSFESVRGNILTRIRKMIESPQTQGLIVAKAAIDRLLSVEGEEFDAGKSELKEYLDQCLWQVLPLSLNPTAAAQGALVVEVASHREDLKEKLKAIHCQDTWESVCEERKILKSYGGGCHQKIGVTQLVRDYGKITFLKGLTDEGETLDKTSMGLKEPLLDEEDSYPLERDNLSWFKRESIDYKRPSVKGHYVSRANSLPENEVFDNSHILWTSGLQTWKALAQRGLWVNGSSESLGESEPLRLEVLERDISWAKWTHEDSLESSWSKNVATYRLIPNEETPVIESKKNFFWMSGSSFSQAVKKNPELIKANHFCGPGSTFKMISQFLKEKNIDKKPQVLLGYEHWKSLLKKEKA